MRRMNFSVCAYSTCHQRHNSNFLYTFGRVMRSSRAEVRVLFIEICFSCGSTEHKRIECPQSLQRNPSGSSNIALYNIKQCCSRITDDTITEPIVDSPTRSVSEPLDQMRITLKIPRNWRNWRRLYCGESSYPVQG